MWDKIVEVGAGVYILWGIGAFGMLLKIIISVYLSGIVKASQDMSTTGKKSLMAIRHKLENRRSLAMSMGSGEAFVNKNIYGMKLLGRPFRFWEKTGRNLCLVVCMLSVGSLLYYDVSWRGSPGMYDFMANAVFVCAFLLLTENIFLVTNKLELLKANIWDYLETTKVVAEKQPVGRRRERIVDEDRLEMCRGSDEAENKAVEPSEDDGLDETAADNEEILNSFLKEFFT